jgi:agmatine deiminase
VKWRFNGWARYRDYALDEAAGLQVARWLGGPVFLPEVGSGQRRRRVVLEGGALDVDGQGSVVVSEECLLTGQRARFKTVGRAEVERLLMAYLGVSRVLWVERGIVGDDTSGHVDDFVRFVAPGRLVLCEERRAADANHRPLSRARECLAGCRDAQGRRLEIIPLPMPDPVFFGPHRLPASYANFYLGNTVVLVPTFNDKADRQALGILAELFPGRRVVGIHALDLVLGLGTLHCSTQPEPFGRARRPRSWTS